MAMSEHAFYAPGLTNTKARFWGPKPLNMSKKTEIDSQLAPFFSQGFSGPFKRKGLIVKRPFPLFFFSNLCQKKTVISGLNRLIFGANEETHGRFQESKGHRSFRSFHTSSSRRKFGEKIISPSTHRARHESGFSERRHCDRPA